MALTRSCACAYTRRHAGTPGPPRGHGKNQSTNENRPPAAPDQPPKSPASCARPTSKVARQLHPKTGIWGTPDFRKAPSGRIKAYVTRGSIVPGASRHSGDLGYPGVPKGPKWENPSIKRGSIFGPGCLEAPKGGDQGYPGVPKGPKWEKLIIKREAFLVPSASRQPKTGNRKLFVLGASRHPRTGIRNTCDAR